MFNQVIAYGRLVANPELRQTQNSILCSFTIAVDRPKSKDGNQATDFIKCTCWNKTADMVSKYFSKGKPIIVEGSLRNNNYTDKNGVKQSRIDVLVTSVEFTINDNSQQQVQSQPRPSVANCQNQQRTYAQQNTNSRPPIPIYPSNQQPVATSYQPQNTYPQQQYPQAPVNQNYEQPIPDGAVPF